MLMANRAYDEKNYDAVIELCDILGSYPGAEDLMKDAQYGKAAELLEAGDARAAYDMFTALVDYKDSPARADDALMLMANQAYDEKNYDAVIELCDMLGSYPGAEDLMTEAQYGKACSLLESGSFLEAEAAFTALGDYSDCADKINECRYQQAVKLYNEGSFEAATKLFMGLPLYKDADHYAVLGMLQYDQNGFIDIMAAGTQVYLQMLGMNYQLKESKVTYERDTREFLVDGDGVDRQTYLVFLPVNAEGSTSGKGQINSIMVRGISWTAKDYEPTLTATMCTAVAAMAALDDAAAQDPEALANLITTAMTGLCTSGPTLAQVTDDGYRATVDIPFDNYRVSASILYYPGVSQFTYCIDIPELIK